MRKIIAISVALMLSTAPAHAQLLGGGIGGGLGGAFGGTLGGAGTFGSPTDSIRSASGGTLSGAASTKGSHSVDHKSGQIQAERAVDTSATGDISHSMTTPTGPLGGNASGNGNVSGTGSANAQLIGTDALSSTAQSLRGTASDASAGAAQSGQNATGGTAALTGAVTGTGSAASSSSPMTAGSNATATAQSAFTITKGTPVLTPDGDSIGKVRQVITDGNGQVQNLLVKVDGQTVLLPAANFTANGEAVVSAMTESQIKQAAEQQQSDSGQSEAGNSSASGKDRQSHSK